MLDMSDENRDPFKLCMSSKDNICVYIKIRIVIRKNEEISMLLDSNRPITRLDIDLSALQYQL